MTDETKDVVLTLVIGAIFGALFSLGAVISVKVWAAFHPEAPAVEIVQPKQPGIDDYPLYTIMRHGDTYGIIRWPGKVTMVGTLEQARKRVELAKQIDEEDRIREMWDQVGRDAEYWKPLKEAP